MTARRRPSIVERLTAPPKPSGFATMTPEARRAAAARGGTVTAERARAGISSPHRFNSETARLAALKRHGK